MHAQQSAEYRSMHYAGFQRSSVFENDYMSFCAELRAALKGRISDSDEHFLKDGADGRHKLVTVQRVMWLAAQSDRPEHHEMMSEIVRPMSVRQACIAAAFDAETEATGHADLMQRHYERTRCKSAWQRAHEALTRQLATTRASLDAMMAHRTWQ